MNKEELKTAELKRSVSMALNTKSKYVKTIMVDMDTVEVHFEQEWEGFVNSIYSNVPYIKPIKSEWISVYNSYVHYDSKPLVTDGFTRVVTYTGDRNTLGFCEHLLNKRLNDIMKLEGIAQAS